VPFEAAEGDGGDATTASGDGRGGRGRAGVVWAVWGGRRRFGGGRRERGGTAADDHVKGAPGNIFPFALTLPSRLF